MDLIFDLEGNDLFPAVTKIHCIEAVDIDTLETYSFGPHNIEEGVKFLMKAKRLIGHNILKYDIPTLEKLYPYFAMREACNDEGMVDTLVISKLIWTNLFDEDMELQRKWKKLGKHFNMLGRHALKAWGMRLGVLKGSLEKDSEDETVWAKWTQEMQEYCAQDVQVTLTFWNHIQKKKYSNLAILLEHKFQRWIFKQEEQGWHFDRKSAAELCGQLSKRQSELKEELQSIFKPIEVKTPFTPKVSNKNRGYEKGVPTFKVKVVEFNPGSDKQIGERLKQQYGWEPEKFTNGGQPEVGEEVLEDLPFPGIKELIEYKTIKKIIGQLANGKNAWLKVEKDGKIHGRVNTNGAVTGRCTHSIIVNVPRVTSPFGKEMRSLLTAPPGGDWVMFGCDASGLELRCLAHFMAKYDNGDYTKVLLSGDIHTENQKAAGLPTRDNAKTFIYGFLYGAGDEKIGSIIGKGRNEGKKIKSSFLKKLPAIKKLKDALERTLDKNLAKTKGKYTFLTGIDGRRIIIRSKHSALNFLLQSAGSLIVKQATIFLCEEMERRFKWGEEWAMVGHFHDEAQLIIRKHLIEEVGAIAKDCFRRAGEHFNFRCPIDSEWKTGLNWSDTH